MKVRNPMHPGSTGKCSKKQRGGALVTVIILGSLVLLLIGSYLSSLTTQHRITNAELLFEEARNAAEGVAAMALGEIDRVTASRSSLFTGNMLDGFTLDADRLNLLAPSGSNIDPASLAFIEGPISPAPTARIPINPIDPININDPSAGGIRSVRTKEIFARASVVDPRTGYVDTSHIAQYIRFTSGAWFDYAVFFNMDLEMHAGSAMTVGATHCNADMYLVSGNNNTLTFTDALTSSGRIYRFVKYNRGTFDASRGVYPGLPAATNHLGRVMCTNFSNTGNVLLAMLNNTYSGGGVLTNDSTRTDMSFAAANTWNGGVMDGTMNVMPFNPPGMPLYVPENFLTPAIDLRNNAYLMIEPQLADRDLIDAYSGGQMNGHKGEVLENTKFSGKAGLTIQVRPPRVDGQQPEWRLVWYRPVNTGFPLSEGNPAMRDTNGQPIILGWIDPFNDVDADDHDGSPPSPNRNYEDPAAPGVPRSPKIQRALRLALLKAIISVPYSDNGSTNTNPYGDGRINRTIQPFTPTAGPDTGDPDTTPAIRVVHANGLTNFNTALASADSREDPVCSPIRDRMEGSPDLDTFNDGSQTDGLRGAFHTIIIDMVALHRVLNNRALWQTVDAGNGDPTANFLFDPFTQFNGVLYVQFPLPATAVVARANLPNSDNIRVAVRSTTTTPGYALLLRNGGGSRNQNSSTGFLPRGPWDAGALPLGFTVATNGPAYIWGHYNANGISVNQATNMNTADPDWVSNHHQIPGDISTPLIPGVEVPALVAADAVTILSANNGYATTGNFSLMTRQQSNRNQANVFTEVATAIIAGLVPTQPDTQRVRQIWAGGVHNFIRFVENWGGGNLGYRGSVVALFENEAVLKPYRENRISYWYNPPNRAIGFHPFFAAGRYPPGTPVVNSVRGINLRDISAEEFAAGPHPLPPYN